MICKYCGNKLSGNICPSCKMVASLSYTSHELADMLGKRIDVNPWLNEAQLKSAYNSGLAEGQKRGFAKGYDSAQKESENAFKRQQRLFIVVAASGAVVLAFLSSIVTSTIRYNSGMIIGQQKQQIADESAIADSYQQGYEAGIDVGYNDGYQSGYDQGLLVTPSPSPTPTPTSKPTTTPKPLMLRMKSKGDEVRQLQERLIVLGYLANNEADGDFGSKTEKAVKQFEANSGLKPTGTVDQDLWDHIMSETATPATTVIQPATATPTVKPVSTPIPESEVTDEAEGSATLDPMNLEPITEAYENDDAVG